MVVTLLIWELVLIGSSGMNYVFPSLLPIFPAVIVNNVCVCVFVLLNFGYRKLGLMRTVIIFHRKTFRKDTTNCWLF